MFWNILFIYSKFYKRTETLQISEKNQFLSGDFGFRVDVRDQAIERPLTGEESSYEQPLEETNTAIHRGLGTLPSDKQETLLEVRTSSNKRGLSSSPELWRGPAV